MGLGYTTALYGTELVDVAVQERAVNTDTQNIVMLAVRDFGVQRVFLRSGGLTERERLV